MDLEIRLNNYLIPDAHIRKYPKSEEVLSVDGRLMPEAVTFQIDNVQELYDDRIAGSMFYGVLSYGWPLTIYNTRLNRYVYSGLLTNYDLSEDVIEIEASSILKNLSKTACVYSNTSNKTPAEIIYELLVSVIDPGYIVYSGFQEAINIQTANSCFVDMSITAAKSATVINVINELQWRTQCEIWSVQNLIYMKQWQPYGGTRAQLVENRYIKPGSYRHYFDAVEIINAYKIAYNNTGTVAYVTGSDAVSIDRYGERVFNIPAEQATSTNPSDFDILFKNSTGAAWAGDLCIQRRKNVAQKGELKLTRHLDFVQMGQQVDLGFLPYRREPVRIVERKHDLDSDEVAVVYEFLNKPVPYFSVDVTPPDSVKLFAAIPIPNGVVITWTASLDADILGYKVYFSTSPGEWYSGVCNRGKSPIDIKFPPQTFDGLKYAVITQLPPSVMYFFRVSPYDTAFNEGDPSNTLSATPMDISDGYYNVHCCSGALGAGIYLEEQNTEGGSPLPGWSLYDTAEYDEDVYAPTAHYTSARLRKSGGFSLITWYGSGDPGDITFQWRSSTDGSVWGSWSAETDAIGLKGVALSGEYIQFRFIFYSPRWTDPDYFYVRQLQ